MLRLKPFRLAVRLVLLSLSVALALHSDPEATAAPQLGQVNFPTSCTANAQPLIETGVALLHSFQYQQADQSFGEALKRDPHCAMAHWGQAMSRYEQLWEFPSAKTLKQGAQEIKRAEAIGASTLRERGYLAAARAFYLGDPKLGETERLKAYSAALAVLRQQAPEDVNATAFYALSLVALAEQQEVDVQANLQAAIAILDPLGHAAPQNPGPAHYLIHATDRPEFAAKGLEAARAYARIAPDSSHALHMPSHIFVRLGLWQESIASNIAASASAAKATREHRSVPHYQFHALDFLDYSYLQSGQESKARQLVEELVSVPGADRESIAEHRAWFAARNAFELHRWREAASLPMPDIPRSSEESIYRVRAIGAARSGDLDSARRNLQKFLETSAEEQRKEHQHHRDKAPEESVRQLEVEAWVAFAEGKRDQAVKALRSAADSEDSDGVDSLAMPAREMLADMLLELKQPAEALTAYQSALKNSPNRFDSLYGALRAARDSGDRAAAILYETNLAAICAPGADRPEIADARSTQSASKQQ